MLINEDVVSNGVSNIFATPFTYMRGRQFNAMTCNNEHKMELSPCVIV